MKEKQLSHFQRLCQQGKAGHPKTQQAKKRRPSEKLIRFINTAILFPPFLVYFGFFVLSTGQLENTTQICLHQNGSRPSILRYLA